MTSVTTAISVIILLDFLLPSISTDHTVKSLVYYDSQNSYKSGKQTRKFGIITNKGQIPVDGVVYNALNVGDLLCINKTPIFGTTTSMVKNGMTYKPISIYNWYCAFPIIYLFSGIWTLKNLKENDGSYFNPLALNIVMTIVLIGAMIFNHFI